MTSKTGTKKGFTLIEVMVAAAILSVGIVLVQQGFLRSATLLAKLSRTLEARQWADEKVWEVKENLFYSQDPSPGEGSGSFESNGRKYSWTAQAEPLSLADLYAVRVVVQWPDGNGSSSVEREVHANSVRVA